MFCNSLIACGLSSLMTSATAITPNKRSSFPKNNGVLPASASFSAFFWISPSTDTLLLIVIYLGKLLITLVNKYAPEEVAPAKQETPRGPAPIPGNILAAITAAVNVVTQGKGKVTKVEKL